MSIQKYFIPFSHDIPFIKLLVKLINSKKAENEKTDMIFVIMLFLEVFDILD